MKNILEYSSKTQSLVDFINEHQEPVLNEGLRDIFAKLKRAFTKVVQWTFGFIVRLSSRQSYWCPSDDNGNVMPCTSYYTMGQAFADGLIDLSNTVVAVTNKCKRDTGCKGKPEDANKLYGSGNSLAYWSRMLKESNIPVNDPNLSTILESYNSKLTNILNEVKLRATDPQAKGNVVDTPMLKKVIKVTLKNKNLPRLLIMGAPGIGKTAILNSVLSELDGFQDYNLVVKTLSNETPDNFTLPKYVEVNGQEKATDVPKTWLPVYKPTGDKTADAQMDEACGKGLLFIDELSRATPQVLNVILPLINEGVFNGYKMGSGWTIICASNRMEDELSGQAPIGNALANRFQIVYYEPTFKSWNEWAKNQGYISPLLLTWLNMPSTGSMGGGKYFYWDPNEEGNDDPSMIMCTPRSWTNAMEVLAAYAETADLEGYKLIDIYETDPDILKLALNSCIPAEAVDSFIAFLDVISKLGASSGGSFDDFVKGIWSKGKGPKITVKDLNKVALPLAQLVIAYKSDKFPTAKEFDNFATWVCRQENDQLASFVLDILNNTYAGMIPDKDSRGLIYVLREMWEQGDAKKRANYEEAFGSFLQKWGFSDPSQMPDLTDGYNKFVETYGDIFTAMEDAGIPIG